jgi:hypothetical protein
MDYDDSTVTDQTSRLLAENEALRKSNERMAKIIDKFMG